MPAPAFRLAMRREGDFWNAYLAPASGMQNAMLIASIHMAAVVDDERRKEAFMELCRGFLDDRVHKIFGVGVASWHTKPAPESERSGHG